MFTSERSKAFDGTVVVMADMVDSPHMSPMFSPEQLADDAAGEDTAERHLVIVTSVGASFLLSSVWCGS